jgi:hypothetical protein
MLKRESLEEVIRESLHSYTFYTLGLARPRRRAYAGPMSTPKHSRPAPVPTFAQIVRAAAVRSLTWSLLSGLAYWAARNWIDVFDGTWLGTAWVTPYFTLYFL